MMTFYVVWARRGCLVRILPVDAETPGAAFSEAEKFFGVRYHEQGQTFVFDRPPSMVYHSQESVI